MQSSIVIIVSSFILSAISQTSESLMESSPVVNIAGDVTNIIHKNCDTGCKESESDPEIVSSDLEEMPEYTTETIPNDFSTVSVEPSESHHVEVQPEIVQEPVHEVIHESIPETVHLPTHDTTEFVVPESGGTVGYESAHYQAELPVYTPPTPTQVIVVNVPAPSSTSSVPTPEPTSQPAPEPSPAPSSSAMPIVVQQNVDVPDNTSNVNGLFPLGVNPGGPGGVGGPCGSGLCGGGCGSGSCGASPLGARVRAAALGRVGQRFGL